MNKEFRVVILAAGKGTRMDSELPKVLHLFKGLTLIDHVLNESALLRPAETILVVGFKKEMIISHTSNRKNLKFVEQKEQLGTGHAVLQTKKLLKNKNGHIVILYGDVPNIKSSTLDPIINQHVNEDRGITLISAELENPRGYGRIFKDNNGKLLKIVEEKDCSAEEKKLKEINSGIFILKIPEIFEIIEKINTNNASKEYYLTDIVEIAQDKMEMKAIKIGNSNEILGVNTIDQLEELNN